MILPSVMNKNMILSSQVSRNIMQAADCNVKDDDDDLLTFLQIWTRPLGAFVAVGHALYLLWLLDTPPE